MFAELNARIARGPYFREDYITASAVNSKIILPAPVMLGIGLGCPLTIIKNGSLLFYGVDYTISGSTVSLTANASPGDAFSVRLYSPVRPKGSAGFSGSAADAYFANVIALLHCDGSNGGTSFPDVISANSWTPSSVTTNTAVQKYGTASAVFVRASASNLYLSTTTTGNVGSSDFTIEAWINPTTIVTTSGQNNFIACKDDISGGTRGWSLSLSGTNSGAVTCNAFVGGTAYSVNSATVPTTGAWTHVAFCRSGQTVTLYVGGVSKGTVSLPSPTSSIGSATYGVRLGSTSPIGSVYSFDGYIDDFRMTVGVCRYTSNFTPTGPFPDHS